MAGGPEMNYAKMSKFLSYHLRHHPEKIGIELDEGGCGRLQILLFG